MQCATTPTIFSKAPKTGKDELPYIGRLVLRTKNSTNASDTKHITVGGSQYANGSPSGLFLTKNTYTPVTIGTRAI
jgi:hypothetical protein